MELTWPIKIRITIALMVGILLLGVLGWQMVSPQNPMAPVAILSGTIGVIDIIACVGLAFLAGFISYFLCAPFGRQIAILAAPGGMAIWSLRTGSMTSLLQSDTSAEFRRTVYSSLRWEAPLWLIIAAAGLIGVLTAEKLSGKAKQLPVETDSKAKPTPNSYLLPIVSIFASAIIARLCIGVLAMNITYFDIKFGQVVGQPAPGQIAFAVIISFAAAAFLLKFFLNTSYRWVAVSTVLLSIYIMTSYGTEDISNHMAASWPAAFFPYSGAAILPVQMVTFGSIGAVFGYWAAVRYRYWRKHESKG